MADRSEDPSETRHVSPSSEDDPYVGKVLGHVRLLERIGKGACGSVYRAEHENLGILFAVKILHQAKANSQNMLKRFKREARAAGQLRHENVVSIADFDIAPQIGPYLIMEYLEGESLEDLLGREGAQPLERVGKIMVQVCSALSAAHEAGIVHRDLKPENIFLVPRKNDELVKILDFGIARLSEGAEALTNVGQTLGTPFYMAPEQCKGEKIDQRTDLYALGFVIYQMLTGRRPFEGGEAIEIIVKHLMTPPPELGLEFPEPIRALVSRMMAKDPEDRPADAQEVYLAFEEWMASSTQDSWFDDPHPSTDTMLDLPALPYLPEDSSEPIAQFPETPPPQNTTLASQPYSLPNEWSDIDSLENFPNTNTSSYPALDAPTLGIKKNPTS